MRTRKNLSGEKFGKWSVLRQGKDRGKTTLWFCRCECGNEQEVYTAHLLSGRSRGCVNCNKEKHGKYGKPPYYTWRAMKKRCYNLLDKDYRYYGEKGIKVCHEWKDSFKNFYNWAMKSGYKEGLTIDRIDSKGDYTPENCRWVTFSQNTHNRWGT